jgi:hypothetical protein
MNYMLTQAVGRHCLHDRSCHCFCNLLCRTDYALFADPRLRFFGLWLFGIDFYFLAWRKVIKYTWVVAAGFLDPLTRSI